jgi:hypothetical protein
VLPAKNYPNNSPDNFSELSYSQRPLTILAVRFGYVSAVVGMLFLATSAAHFIRDENYPLLVKGLMYIVAVFVAMISGRDYVYRIDVIGDRLLLQTAFSKKEYRMSELKDIYKKGDLQGGFAWIIKTSDCDYKFQAKDPAARNFLDKLLTRIPSSGSISWNEFSMSDFTEKRLFVVTVFLLLCAIYALTAGHVMMIGIACLLCTLFSVFSMGRVARQVKVNQAGLTIMNLLKQEKAIPWQSITSLKRTKAGALFLNSAQGRFALSAVDGSNILLQKTARNVAPNLFTDEQNPLPKLNQNKR